MDFSPPQQIPGGLKSALRGCCPKLNHASNCAASKGTNRPDCNLYAILGKYRVIGCPKTITAMLSAFYDGFVERARAGPEADSDGIVRFDPRKLPFWQESSRHAPSAVRSK